MSEDMIPCTNCGKLFKIEDLSDSPVAVYDQDDTTDDLVCDPCWKELRVRLQNCYSACSGMSDPAEEIKRLREVDGRHSCLIDRAVCFAFHWHKHQRDKQSQPYILHLIRVMDAVSVESANDEVIAASVLHDILEDTGCKLEDLVVEFGEGVAALVDILTHRKHVTYTGYILHLMNNRDAAIIKCADLRDNLSRIDTLDEDTKVRLYNKYKPALELLYSAAALKEVPK
jgi:(p)ppGpp synthase/HD superfamily hydrolase